MLQGILSLFSTKDDLAPVSSIPR